jgi:hypothetical protein
LANNDSNNKRKRTCQYDKIKEKALIALITEFPHIDDQYRKYGNISAKKHARLVDCARLYQGSAFKAIYFQEMLAHCGWEVFEVYDKETEISRDIIFIPAEYVQKRNISQSNYKQFTKGIDYFVSKIAVINFLLKDEQSSISPPPTTATSTTSITATLSSGGNHVGSNRSIAMKKDDITR